MKPSMMPSGKLQLLLLPVLALLLAPPIAGWKSPGLKDEVSLKDLETASWKVAGEGNIIIEESLAESAAASNVAATTAKRKERERERDRERNVEPPTDEACTGDQKVDEVLRQVSLAPAHAKKLVLACAIYTYQGNRQKLVETYATWGKGCDHFLAYSDEQFIIDKASSIKTTKLHSGKGQVFGTSRLIHKDLADKLDAGTLDFDFVTVSGDDALFILPNLRSYLSTLTPLTRNNSFKTGHHDSEPDFDYEYIGGIDPSNGHSDFPWVGGAGYVLNRKVVSSRLLNSTLCQQQSMDENEDVAVSRCLFKSRVVPRDSRDAEGHHRFCRSKPQKPCVLGGTNEAPSKHVVLWHYMEGPFRDRVSKCLHELM